jgi:F-type H+-transporting ATPase subunit delta
VAERATIARPYAKAAFEYARDAKAFANGRRAVCGGRDRRRSARRGAHQEPALDAADLADLIIDVAGAKLDAGCRISCACSRRTGACCCCRRSRALRGLRVPTAENTVDVEVVSAVALDAAQRRSSSAALSTRFKRSVRMQNFRRCVAAGRRGGARRGSGHRRLAEGPSATTRNRFGKLELKVMRGPD